MQHNKDTKLSEGILNMYAMPRQDLDLLMNAFTEAKFPARTMLFKSGQVSEKMYFISKGCMRAFYQSDDKEPTLWLGHEGDFVTCFRSWITRTQGHENIQLTEDCLLYSIGYKELIGLAQNNPQINHFYRRILEEGFIYWEKRTIMLLFKSARERYDDLISRSPQALHRWPLSHIASYLGITQETLSRLRSEK